MIQPNARTEPVSAATPDNREQAAYRVGFGHRAPRTIRPVTEIATTGPRRRTPLHLSHYTPICDESATQRRRLALPVGDRVYVGRRWLRDAGLLVLIRRVAAGVKFVFG